jgi:hypothetical protein
MTAITPTLLFIGNQQSGVVYSAPASEGSYAIIKSINVANTSTSNQVFSINLVPPAGTVGINNVIVGNVNMSGNNVFSYETSIVMPAGSTLQVSQVANNLTFTISGVEYVV